MLKAQKGERKYPFDIGTSALYYSQNQKLTRFSRSKPICHWYERLILFVNSILARRRREKVETPTYHKQICKVGNAFLPILLISPPFDICLPPISIPAPPQISSAPPHFDVEVFSPPFRRDPPQNHWFPPILGGSKSK